ncbi:hypothetical protein B0H63DRAFT_489399 [Podospora didyma]|uniref:Uncharacterized protein n=1 Tax=Podospora didyma TaxID=330526 RepID=A0AAE0K0R5_9PEZI|nr:hypothetical protein B0H63DRAFT_489399 [Podospora didyma]
MPSPWPCLAALFIYFPSPCMLPKHNGLNHDRLIIIARGFLSEQPPIPRSSGWRALHRLGSSVESPTWVWCVAVGWWMDNVLPATLQYGVYVTAFPATRLEVDAFLTGRLLR